MKIFSDFYTVRNN